MKKKIKVTKTYRGLVELRDYDVKQCIEDDNSIEVEFDKEVMTLSPEQLKSDIRSTSKLFTSKVGGKSYKLFGYEWEPDEIEL
jgi:hypothetical protein